MQPHDLSSDPGVQEQGDPAFSSEFLITTHVLSCKFINGPRTSFTIPLRFSTFISARQQIIPSVCQLIRASLSPVPIPAFSRISFGSTICPRSSTLNMASTLQPGLHPHPSEGSFGGFIPLSGFFGG